MTYPSDIAFTESVKAIQSRKQSRDAYAQMESRASWPTEITPELARFIAMRTSFYLGTANSIGQPYIQHRGGPQGFLHVIDKTTLAFADFRGNQQYITQGNLAENAKAFLFLVDYSNSIRYKIWGTARVIENNPALLQTLMAEDYRASGEQSIIFKVSTWDRNCPQHLPKWTLGE